MTDRRLRAAGRLHEVASADLVLRGRDERQQSQTDRVGEGGERVSEELGLILVEGILADRRAAGDGIERCGAASDHGETISKIVEEIH